MSKGFSYAQIGGVLGRDPESRSTPGGTKVVNFSVAVEKGFGDKQSTAWFNIVAFGQVGEFAEKYLKKGKGVLVTGDLQTRSWDDKQTGQKRTTTEVVAYKLDFADFGGGKSEGRQQSQPQTRQQTPAPSRQAANDDPFADPSLPDDIPF